MKRILSAILALFMLCGMMLMTACGGTDQTDETTTGDVAETTTEATTEATTTEETTTEETTAEVTPTPVYTEWATYDDGVFSFSYPKAWTVMDEMVADDEGSNSIMVMTEPKNDEYAKMDDASYMAEMSELFGMMGLTVSEASVKQTKTAGGLDATVMFYALDMGNTWIGEHTIAITIGETTYDITVTETLKDTDLIDTVMNSLAITPIVKPTGNTTYTNGAISFSYPAAWEETESMGVLTLASENGNNITIAEEPQTDAYMKMTAEDFGNQLKPVFEMMGLSVTDLTLEVCENANGVPMVKIAYGLEMEGFWMGQTLFIVNAGESTYTVTITEVIKDAELIATVFDSLTIVA